MWGKMYIVIMETILKLKRLLSYTTYNNTVS